MPSFVRPALVYLALGCAWIVGTDLLVGAEPHFSQTVKGLFFVAVSALVILLLVRREGREIEKDREWYRSLFEFGVDTVFVLDENDRIVEANRTACRKYGYLPREFRSLTRADLIAPGEASTTLEASGTAGERVERRQARHVRTDGTTFPVIENERSIRVGRTERRLLVVRDITQLVRAEESLRASEAFLRALVSCSPLALFGVDADGKVTAWNESAERIFGWTVDEVIGRPLPIVPPESQAQYAESRRRVMNGERLVGMRLVRRRKDGSEVDVSLSAARLTDEAGSLDGIVAIMEDITERRRHEIALAESEERYRSIFENNSAMIMVADLDDLTILDANPAAEKFYGWSRDELRRMKITDLDPTPVEDLRRQIAEVAPGRTGTGEFRHRLADGRMADVEIFAGPARMGGRPVLFAIVHDIARRMRARAAAREAEDRFRLVVKASPFPIVVHAEGGEILYLNDAWTRISGYGKEDLPTVASWIGRAYPGREDEVLDHILGQYDLEGPAAEGEYRVRCRDGSLRTWDFMSTPLGRLPDGRRAVLSMAMDVTERRTAEEHIAKTQNLESIARLAGFIAHDFNNLLTMILGRADLASAHAGGSPIAKHLDEIRDATGRAAALTRQLLTIARQQPLHPVPLAIDRQVEVLLPTLRSILGDERTLRWEPGAPDVDDVIMDPVQLDRILVNLCTNARDATTPLGNVWISTLPVSVEEDDLMPGEAVVPGPFILLTVRDDGSGMDESTLARIWEPFFTTKPSGKGTGLGLPSVFGIITQAGGYIRVDSSPGIGTRFQLYIPRSGSAPCGKDLAPAAAQVSADEPPEFASILLVDDEPILLDMAAELLEDLGHHVTPVLSAESALEVMGRPGARCNLVITDVILPGMDGPTMAERLRERFPGLPVVFTSGYGPDIVTKHPTAVAGACFLEKPFSVADLAAVVAKSLHSR